MISRSHRFHGLRSLNYVYKTGAVARGPMFAVKASINPRNQSYRAAVVISRKVHKSAVVRNRMRRRLYTALRGLESQIDGPHDIVLTVFNDTMLETTPADVTKQLKKQLKDVGAIVPKRSS